MGQDQHALSRENAELADALRTACRDAESERQRNEQLRTALARYRSDAEQREQAERQVPMQTIRRQWEALAVRIARQASGNTALPLAGLDQEVVTTWQRLRQQDPATGKTPTSGKNPAAPARAARTTRTTTPPKRRNR